MLLQSSPDSMSAKPTMVHAARGLPAAREARHAFHMSVTTTPKRVQLRRNQQSFVGHLSSRARSAWRDWLWLST